MFLHSHQLEGSSYQCSDAEMEVFDTELFPQPNIADLDLGKTFSFVLPGETFKHTHTYTHTHTQTHKNAVHTHSHIHILD